MESRYIISTLFFIIQNGFFALAISPDILRSSMSTPDFLHNFVRMPDGSRLNVSDLVHEDGNTDAMHISGVGTARLASYDRCEPRFVTVMLPKDMDSNVLLWPPCTRIERCSGCCPSDVLVCEPVQTELVTFRVIKNIMPYQGSPEFQYGGMKEVTVERHTKCDQRCRVKAHHCNPNIHDYLERDCRCRCKNRVTCASSKHIWRENNCKCECVQKRPCTGFARFDESTCECALRQTIMSEMTDEEREELRNILSGNEEQPEPTTTTTTTTAPAPLGCPPMHCMPGWAPRRWGHTCRCFPSGFGRR